MTKAKKMMIFITLVIFILNAALLGYYLSKPQLIDGIDPKFASAVIKDDNIHKLSVKAGTDKLTLDEIMSVNEGAIAVVTSDEEGSNVIDNQNIPISRGNNTIYVRIEKDKTTKTYQIDIYRNKTFTLEKIFKNQLLKSTQEDEGGFDLGDYYLSGYKFLGWYDNPELKGNKLPLTIKIDKNTKVYAKLVAEEHSVKYFDKNDVEIFTNNPKTHTVEQEVLLEDAQKDNYTFDGWFIKGTTTQIKKLDKNIVQDTQLVAKFSPVVYTIDYVLNGSQNNQTNPVSYTVESSTILLQPAVRETDTFEGWYDSETGGNKVTEIVPTLDHSNLVLHARFTKTVYKITYELDGSENNANNPSTVSNEQSDIILLAPTKLGYEFNGWFDRKVDGVKYTKIPKNIQSDLLLYAKFSLITYSITYNLDNSQNDLKNPQTFNVESETIRFENPTKKGYTFQGWFNASTEGIEVTQILRGSHNDVELFARFTKDVYSIRYRLNVVNTPHSPLTTVDNPETYTVDSPNIILNLPSKKGYKFDGWYNEDTSEQIFDQSKKVTTIETGSVGNLVLTAQFIAIDYRIKYTTYETAMLSTPTHPNRYAFTIEDEFDIKPAVAKGYTFTEWALYGNPDQKVTRIEKGTDHDYHLSLVMPETKYNINYHLLPNDVNGLNNPKTYTISNNIEFTNPSRSGYEFKGWFKQQQFIDPITNIKRGETGDLEIYPKFELLTFNITYNIEYRKNVGFENPISNWRSFNVNTPKFNLVNPINPGFTFIEWRLDTHSGEVVTSIDPKDVKYHRHFTLVAIQNLEEYDVTFESYGGAHGNKNRKYTIDGDYSYFEEPTKFGYKFLGWYNSEDPILAKRYYNIPAGTTGRLNLYARYEQNTYDIKYRSELNIISISTPRTFKTTDPAFILSEPTVSQKGFEFVEWQYQQRPITQFNPALYNEEVTLFAVFRELTFTLTHTLPEGVINTAPEYINRLNRTFTAKDHNINLNELILPGYVFSHWVDKKTNTRIDVVNTDRAENVVVVAVLSDEITYTVDYVLHSLMGMARPRKFKISELPLKLENPHGVGFRFNRWYTQTIGGIKQTITDITVDYVKSHSFANNTLIIYADFELVTYNITYTNTHGVQNPNLTRFTVDTPMFTLKPIVVNGYKFKRWIDTTTGREITDLITYKGIPYTLRADLELINYRINYHSDLDSTTIPNITSYNIESQITLQPATNPHYIFLGYKLGSPAGESITEIKNMYGDIDLYLEFTPNVYNISYVGLKPESNHQNPSQRAYGSTLVLKPANDTTDFKFLHWEYEGAKIETITNSITGPITLTAVYQQIHTIAVSLDGQIRKYSVLDGETFNETITPQSNYNFHGYSNKDNSGILFDQKTPIKKSYLLEAIVKPNNYIKYDFTFNESLIPGQQQHILTFSQPGSAINIPTYVPKYRFDSLKFIFWTTNNSVKIYNALILDEEPSYVISAVTEEKDKIDNPAITYADSSKTIIKSVDVNQLKDQSLYIPRNVVIIGQSALAYTAIKTVTGGEYLSRIEASAFANTNSLETITISSIKPVSQISTSAFAASRVREVDIPVTQIDYFAFSNTRYLTSLNLSKTEYIGAFILQGSNLQSINLANNIESIADAAFEGSKINQINFINYRTGRVGSIGKHAFAGLKLASSINLPRNIEHMDNLVFAGSSFTTIYYRLRVNRDEYRNYPSDWNAGLTIDPVAY